MLFSTVYSTLSTEENEINEEKHEALLLNSLKSYYEPCNKTNVENVKRKVKLLLNSIRDEANFDMMEEESSQNDNSRSSVSDDDSLIEENHTLKEEL